MFKQYPSHMKAKCKVPGCTEETRKDRMPDHLKNKHGINPDYIEGQQKIIGFFARSADAEQSMKNDQENIQQPSKKQIHHARTTIAETFDTSSKASNTEKGTESLQTEEGAKSLDLQDFEVRKTLIIFNIYSLDQELIYGKN